MQPKGVVVLNSGGQDSALVMGLAKQNYDFVYSLSFFYGQRHSAELKSAEKIAEIFQVDGHEVVVISGTLIGTSPLVNQRVELEQYENFEHMQRVIGERLEKTFVPMRNALMLTIAANRAFCFGVSNIATGINADDAANYPDCRQNFVEIIERMFGAALGVDKYKEIQGVYVDAPLINLAKNEMIKLALNVPKVYYSWAYTHTAYDGKYPPVSNDHASVLRRNAFEKAGLPDPLVVRAWLENLMDLPNAPNYDIVRENAVSSIEDLCKLVGAK